jgi:hypothetical protein
MIDARGPAQMLAHPFTDYAVYAHRRVIPDRHEEALRGEIHHKERPYGDKARHDGPEGSSLLTYLDNTADECAGRGGRGGGQHSHTDHDRGQPCSRSHARGHEET